MTNDNITTLDVREDFRAGKSPCDKIKGALDRVSPDASLRLLVPFEPVPLFTLAASKGLTHTAAQSATGDWEVLFRTAAGPTPNPATAAAAAPIAACGCGCSETKPSEILDVDARGLEPPQPMVQILEALDSLPARAALRARTDRRPVHLLPLLEARGFAGESEEQADGSFVTHIRRH